MALCEFPADWETVCFHHGTVVCLVSLAKFWRHGYFIIQVCQTAIRI